jgi:hypothetical protein
MNPEIKIQKDFYLTEASIELPADIGQLSEILKATKTTGKLVIQYNQGSVQGVNVEQRTKISDTQATKIRPLLEIGEKIL